MAKPVPNTPDTISMFEPEHNPNDRRNGVRIYLRDTRVAIGNCPDCRRLITVANDHKVWPLVRCGCGHEFGIDELANGHVFHDGGAFTKI